MERLSGGGIIDLVLGLAFAGVRALAFEGPGEADRFVSDLWNVSSMVSKHGGDAGVTAVGESID